MELPDWRYGDHNRIAEASVARCETAGVGEAGARTRALVVSIWKCMKRTPAD